jgi:hypothetical protein
MGMREPTADVSEDAKALLYGERRSVGEALTQAAAIVRVEHHHHAAVLVLEHLPGGDHVRVSAHAPERLHLPAQPGHALPPPLFAEQVGGEGHDPQAHLGRARQVDPARPVQRLLLTLLQGLEHLVLTEPHRAFSRAGPVQDRLADLAAQAGDRLGLLPDRAWVLKQAGQLGQLYHHARGFPGQLERHLLGSQDHHGLDPHSAECLGVIDQQRLEHLGLALGHQHRVATPPAVQRPLEAVAADAPLPTLDLDHVDRVRGHHHQVVLEPLPARLGDQQVRDQEVVVGKLPSKPVDDPPLWLVDRPLATGRLDQLSHASTSRMARSSSASACSRNSRARLAFVAKFKGSGGTLSVAMPSGLMCGIEVPYD